MTEDTAGSQTQNGKQNLEPFCFLFIHLAVFYDHVVTRVGADGIPAVNVRPHASLRCLFKINTNLGALAVGFGYGSFNHLQTPSMILPENSYNNRMHQRKHISIHLRVGVITNVPDGNDKDQAVHTQRHQQPLPGPGVAKIHIFAKNAPPVQQRVFGSALEPPLFPFTAENPRRTHEN